MTAPTAPPPRAEPIRPPGINAGARDLLEIAGSLIALGFAGWVFTEFSGRLGAKIRSRVGDR